MVSDDSTLMDVRRELNTHDARIKVLEENAEREKAFRAEVREGMKFLREFADKVLDYMKVDTEGPG